MKFFYTMYGKTMGTLSITLEQRWGKAATIFSRSGNQGVHWIGAKVSLDVPEGAKFQVITANNAIMDVKKPTNKEERKLTSSSLPSVTPSADAVGTFTSVLINVLFL